MNFSVYNSECFGDKKLIQAAKQSAISALKIFNDPFHNFKYESYLMLIMVAWTYLMHDYLKCKDVDVRYYKSNKSKKLEYTKQGSVKFWELEKCLRHSSCPLPEQKVNRLIELIHLRHEVEHQMTTKDLSQKHDLMKWCFIEFNQFLRDHFGTSESLDDLLDSFICRKQSTWDEENELREVHFSYPYHYAVRA